MGIVCSGKDALLLWMNSLGSDIETILGTKPSDPIRIALPNRPPLSAPDARTVGFLQ